MLTFEGGFVFLIAQKRPQKRGLFPKLKFQNITASTNNVS